MAFQQAYVPTIGKTKGEDLRRGIRILNNIEEAVFSRYGDSHGPLPLLLGISALVGCSTKLHYVLNMIDMETSYDAVHNIRKGLCANFGHTENGTLAQLRLNKLTDFATENLDQ